MLITALDQVNSSNHVIVLYPSGASGEFLAGTIANTFHGIHSSHINEYVTRNRYTYFDLFDRVLNSSMSDINQEEVLAGVNNYFSTNFCGDLHIGLAHTTSNILMFIEQYLPNTRIVEVTTHSPVSKKFRYIAAECKISKHQTFTNAERINFRYGAMRYDESGIHSNNKLTIEWADLFTDTHNVIRRLQEFLHLNCNHDDFVQRTQEYTQRNYELMRECVITPSL